jgi:hypothetical protein
MNGRRGHFHQSVTLDLALLLQQRVMLRIVPQP